MDINIIIIPKLKKIENPSVDEKNRFKLIQELKERIIEKFNQNNEKKEREYGKKNQINDNKVEKHEIHISKAGGIPIPPPLPVMTPPPPPPIAQLNLKNLPLNSLKNNKKSEQINSNGKIKDEIKKIDFDDLKKKIQESKNRRDRSPSPNFLDYKKDVFSSSNNSNSLSNINKSNDDAKNHQELNKTHRAAPLPPSSVNNKLTTHRAAPLPPSSVNNKLTTHRAAPLPPSSVSNKLTGIVSTEMINNQKKR
jgi:hypothetical protein